jgi:hypothetical protein
MKREVPFFRRVFDAKRMFLHRDCMGKILRKELLAARQVLKELF